MLTKIQANEILQALQSLPADKLAEVYDYLTYLRERYGHTIPANVSNEWSDEDLNDLVVASLNYADQTM